MVEKQAQLQESVCDFESIATRYFYALDANEVPDPSYRDNLDSENTDWVFFEQTQTPLLLDRSETTQLFSVIGKGEKSEVKIKNGNGNLTKEQKVLLSNDIQKAKLAKDIVIYGHLHLVTSLANKYAKDCTLPFFDLIQEGTIGLMDAIKRYDPSKNSKFSTYAFYWVRKDIIKAIIDKSRTIKIPPEQAAKINIYKKTFCELEQILGRVPNTEEIAQKMGITEKKLKKIVGYIYVHDPILTLLQGHANKPKSPYYKIESEIIDDNEANTLKKLSEQLPDRLRHVLYWKTGIFDYEILNSREIAERLGIARQSVDDIYERAIKKLQKLYYGIK